MKRRNLTLSFGLLVALLAAGAPSAFAVALTRGPYLQIAHPTGITIRWRTDTAVESVVRWGSTFSNLDQSLETQGPTTEHVMALTGLSAGTTYYYSVGTAAQTLAGGNADHRFRTSPLPGTPGPTRVWILGDSGLFGASAIAVRNAYLASPGSENTDVWLMLGDNAYNTGTDAEYQAGLFNLYPTVLRRAALWPTRGNHDQIHTGPNNDYYDHFTLPSAGQAGGLPSTTEAYWSFDHANIHFICLDSEGTDRSAGGDMMDWLTLDLAATSQPWVVAFFHHPPYTKGSHNSDNVSDSGGRMRDMRENALPVLEAGGVDLVLTGHSHSYERSMFIDGHYGVSSTFNASMIVDGGDGDPAGDGPYTKAAPTAEPHAGAVHAVAGSSAQTSGGLLNHPVMVTSLNVLGSMVLDVDGLTMDAIFLDSTGNVRDTFRIAKGTASGSTHPAAGALRLSLGDASPNPFDVRTTVSFTLAEAAAVRLRVIEVGGRTLATLTEGSRDAGSHRVEWNGVDDGGKPVAPGVYFLLLDAGGEMRVKRIVRRDRARD